MFGLTEKSGVEIEESDPKVSDALSVVSAIGQGTNNFTTAGLARYVTTVANNGTCYDLTLLDKVTDTSGNLWWIIRQMSATRWRCRRPIGTRSTGA